jgi:hypothetical protein
VSLQNAQKFLHPVALSKTCSTSGISDPNINYSLIKCSLLFNKTEVGKELYSDISIGTNIAKSIIVRLYVN